VEQRKLERKLEVQKRKQEKEDIKKKKEEKEKQPAEEAANEENPEKLKQRTRRRGSVTAEGEFIRLEDVPLSPVPPSTPGTDSTGAALRKSMATKIAPIPRYMETGRTSPAIVDPEGHFRIRPLTRSERVRLNTSESTRSLRSRGYSTGFGSTVKSLGEFIREGGRIGEDFDEEEEETTHFKYFDDSVSFGMHSAGEVPMTAREDIAKYRLSKHKTDLRIERDRPFEGPDPNLFMFPSVQEGSRSRWGRSPEPSFLLKEPKDGYWKDENFKKQRHTALYGNYEVGRRQPIPPAFKTLKKSQYPIRSLKPNAYYRRSDVKGSKTVRS